VIGTGGFTHGKLMPGRAFLQLAGGRLEVDSHVHQFPFRSICGTSVYFSGTPSTEGQKGLLLEKSLGDGLRAAESTRESLIPIVVAPSGDGTYLMLNMGI
jgi:hypothetical protein